MNVDLQQLQQLVRTIASTCLLPRFSNVQRHYKKDGSIVTEADKMMQAKLTAGLAELYPHIALLGEEMTPEQQQALIDSGQPIWCLDPIDGTSNFAAGLPFFSVSLALIENARVTYGVVFDPVRDECFAAAHGQGAWLNGEPLVAQTTGLKLKQAIALIDFKRLPSQMAAKLVTDLPFGSQRNLGSIALELCWLAAGRGHVYLHGNQHIWDYAAADLIVAEAGAYSSSLEGETLFTNSLAPRSSCAAVDEALFTSWKHYLHSIRSDD